MTTKRSNVNAIERCICLKYPPNKAKARAVASSTTCENNDWAPPIFQLLATAGRLPLTICLHLETSRQVLHLEAWRLRAWKEATAFSARVISCFAGPLELANCHTPTPGTRWTVVGKRRRQPGIGHLTTHAFRHTS